MEIGITLNNQLVCNKEFFSKKDIRQSNEFSTYLMKNQRLRNCAIFLIAGLNIATEVLADTGETMAKLDRAGFVFLGLVQRIGFWVCLIGCLLEILFAVFKEGKGKNALLPIALKWLGIYASFYLLPECFKLIRDLFA